MWSAPREDTEEMTSAAQVGLCEGAEQIGAHAGNVAHVVAHVVCHKSAEVQKSQNRGPSELACRSMVSRQQGMMLNTCFLQGRGVSKGKHAGLRAGQCMQLHVRDARSMVRQELPACRCRDETSDWNQGMILD